MHIEVYQTETLIERFNRLMAARLRGRLCDGCKESYCDARRAAYALESQGVSLEPIACPSCDGWTLVAALEVKRAA